MHRGNKSDVPTHELAETKNVPWRFMQRGQGERERERRWILREISASTVDYLRSERSSLRKDKCVSVWNDVSFLAVIRYAINARQRIQLASCSSSRKSAWKLARISRAGRITHDSSRAEPSWNRDWVIFRQEQERIAARPGFIFCIGYFFGELTIFPTIRGCQRRFEKNSFGPPTIFHPVVARESVLISLQRLCLPAM